MFFHSHCWHKIKGSEYAVPLMHKHNKYIYELYETMSGASGFVEYAYDAKFECCECEEIVTRTIIDSMSELRYRRHPYQKKKIEQIPETFYEFEDHKLKKRWSFWSLFS